MLNLKLVEQFKSIFNKEYKNDFERLINIYDNNLESTQKNIVSFIEFVGFPSIMFGMFLAQLIINHTDFNIYIQIFISILLIVGYPILGLVSSNILEKCYKQENEKKNSQERASLIEKLSLLSLNEETQFIILSLTENVIEELRKKDLANNKITKNKNFFIDIIAHENNKIDTIEAFDDLMQSLSISLDSLDSLKQRKNVQLDEQSQSYLNKMKIWQKNNLSTEIELEFNSSSYRERL